MDRKDRAEMVMTALMCAALAFMAGWGAAETYTKSRAQPETLAPAGQELRPSDDGIAEAVTTALWADPGERHTLRVHPENNENFRQRLWNIGAQRGWFTHQSERDTVRMVVPEHELPQVAEIKKDPIGWIKENTDLHAPAVGPSGPDLVNVSITIHNHWGSSLRPRLASVSMLALLAWMSTLVSIIAIISLASSRNLFREVTGWAVEKAGPRQGGPPHSPP